MKMVLFLAALSLSQAAFGGDRDISITMHPSYSSGVYTTEVRLEKDKVSGTTSFHGPSISVLLKTSPTHYEGWVGDANVELDCAAKTCKGVINRMPARFEYSYTREGAMKVSGAMNYNHFEVVVSEKKLDVHSKGGMSLKRYNNDTFTGTGYLTSNPRSRVDVTVRGGDLALLFADPALLAIFVAGPFSN